MERARHTAGAQLMPISCLWGWPPPLAWLLMNLALQEGREVEVAKNRSRNKEKRVGMRRRVGTRSSHRWPSAWPLSPCLPCTQADKIGTGFLPSAYQKQVIFKNKTKQNKIKSPTESQDTWLWTTLGQCGWQEICSFASTACEGSELRYQVEIW